MNELLGKKALVTGGSRGIGAATAVALAERGADVAITYSTSADAAATVVKEIEGLGRRGFAFAVDAGDVVAAADGVRLAAEALGGLDILVNNAGVGAIAPIGELAAADIDRVLAVNVRGVYATTQAAVPLLADGARLIHLGSCVAERVPFAGMTLYAMSKSALTGLSKALARELGPRAITSNVVQPGPIDTDMNPADAPSAEPQLTNLALPRFGTPAEVAAAITYLAGPQAAYITGTELTIAGGHTA
ncbi:NAD(P)-dependent dehydrogenase (short-subunit alcohol dehydrogenase family) [Kribbella aluminosa]|uniref:NAD(P)-dependent dehydrogenase (Short-subunit alcohol dehydrogenase family) n=1 Tax=Kribbella aluminosa TaxID=416017 RepID=A0ABS4UEH8_9ACTN|nr:SDR family oxidoreductase [Kribbella aluminosa]MBP2349976.1 NAD(P)-dependent dehydrogenase (short-subunit alcohol dehydrogenase family) [Kribbella aluminosa]